MRSWAAATTGGAIRSGSARARVRPVHRQTQPARRQHRPAQAAASPGGIRKQCGRGAETVHARYRAEGDTEPERTWRFALRHRQRFHLGVLFVRQTEAVWPRAPHLDREVLAAAGGIPFGCSGDVSWSATCWCASIGTSPGCRSIAEATNRQRSTPTSAGCLRDSPEWSPGASPEGFACRRTDRRYESANSAWKARVGKQSDGAPKRRGLQPMRSLTAPRMTSWCLAWVNRGPRGSGGWMRSVGGFCWAPRRGRRRAEERRVGRP